ncbi:MAG: Bax protein [Marinoscillum sp.]|jgi:Bax protein
MQTSKQVINAFLVLLIIVSSCKEPAPVVEPVLILRTNSIKVKALDDIVVIDSVFVKPNLYSNVPSFEGLPVADSKAKFIGAVLPAVLVSKYRIGRMKGRAEELLDKAVWTADDSIFFNAQAERFKASDLQDLIVRMQTHPNSIVLAQAAVESGWGSSRFFQDANNVFGVWSYNEDEPRIEANSHRWGDKIYLRAYEDISESVTDYFETVGRTFAYDTFRTARNNTQDIYQLLPHLKYYSERREEYVAQLTDMIQQNDFTKYDSCRIDPSYFEPL